MKDTELEVGIWESYLGILIGNPIWESYLAILIGNRKTWQMLQMRINMNNKSNIKKFN